MKKDRIVFEEWVLHGVHAAVTTRHFPLFLQKTDDLLDPHRQKKFTESFGRYKRFALLNQVHGSGVAVLDGAEAGAKQDFHHMLNTDAAITNIQQLALLVFTADCLSIYFHAGSWVGLAHAGWRGTKDDIAVKTLSALCERSGVPASETRVIFGPSICADHYEVGEEFKNYFDPGSLREKNSWLCLDVRAENRLRLLRAGILPEKIIDRGLCTVCENDRFYSFRREKEAAGRMVSLAAID